MSVVGSIPMHFRQIVFRPFIKEEKMFGVGMPELIVILVIILIIFGAGKLPQIGEGLGRGIRNFKKATTKEQEDEAGAKKLDEKKSEEK
jgi:sec-independent protein translocase protein TatA